MIGARRRRRATSRHALVTIRPNQAAKRMGSRSESQPSHAEFERVVDSVLGFVAVGQDQAGEPEGMVELLFSEAAEHLGPSRFRVPEHSRHDPLAAHAH